MRSSVASDTGFPSSGSRWVNVVTGAARSHTSSSRRPSTTMADDARTEWTAGTEAWEGPVWAADSAAAAMTTALTTDARLFLISNSPWTTTGGSWFGKTVRDSGR